MAKIKRIGLYVNEKDKKTLFDMDNIIAQSYGYRNRNRYIWDAINEKNDREKLPIKP